MSTLIDQTPNLLKPIALPDLGIPTTKSLLDDAVKSTRAKGMPVGAENRRADRLSVDEVNDLSLDDIRERFIRTSTDNRGPIETVLDWLDAPRNVIMSTLAPGLRRRAESQGDRGAFGLGRVNASDVLEEVGIEQPIVRGVLGFVGDVAFDPLTYLGAPAKGLQLAAGAADGTKAVYGLTKAGRKALLQGIDDVARGGVAADREVGEYLAKTMAAKGIQASPDAKNALASHVLGDLHTPGIMDVGSDLVHGKPLQALGTAYDATVERWMRPLGSTKTYHGAGFAADVDRLDEIGDAARNVLRKYGEYISEPGVRLGVAKGQAATRLAHIPFTDISLSVPQIIPNSHALKTAAVANMTRNGSLAMASTLPEAAALAVQYEGLATDAGRMMDVSEAGVAEEARLRSLSDDDFPPDVPPSTGPSSPSPIGPAPTPTPGGTELNAATEVPPPVKAGNVQVDGGGVSGGQAAQDTGIVGEMGEQLPPVKTRAELIGEMNAAFSDVDEDARSAAVALADARARAMGQTPEEYWTKTFAGFGGNAGSLDQAHRGSVEFLDDGRAMVSALTKPDASTIPHELSHVFRRGLREHEIGPINTFYRIGDKGWTVAQEERYAKDFERYLATGDAPTKELEGVFRRFKQWLADIYFKIVGTPLEGKLSPTMRDHFARILGGDPTINKAALKSAKPSLREGQILGSQTGIASRLRDMMVVDPDTVVTSWINDARRLNEAGFDGENAAMEAADGFSASFSGPIPTEVREWMQGRSTEIRKIIRGNTAKGDPTKGVRGFVGSGNTSLSLLNDKWYDAALLLYGNPAERAEVYAKMIPDGPEKDFFVNMLRRVPSKQGHIPREAIDLADLPPNTAMSIYREPAMIVEDEAGRKFLRYAHGDDVPVESIGRFVADAGSVRQLDDAEAVRMAESINPTPNAKYGQAADMDLDPAMVGGDDGPLFQGGKDVPNQVGLFGQGNVGPSGERQGGLFGDISKTPEQKIDPTARREGESLEDWKIRIKFKEAEQNTGRLFQGGSDPLFPRDRAIEAHREKVAAEKQAIIDQAAARVKVAENVLAGLDAEAYGRTPQTMQAAMFLKQQYNDAVLALDRANAVKETTENLVRQLGILPTKDKETVLRELAPLGDKLADRVYTIAMTDPDAAEKLADLAQKSVSTASALAESLRSQFVKFASSADRSLTAYAMNVLGTDNRQMARTAFRSMADIARRMGVEDQNPLISVLNSMDESARRTFGIRGGYGQRAVADMNAEARGVTAEAMRWQDRVAGRLRDVVGQKLPFDQFDDAQRIVYGLMHEIVDPGQSGFNWFIKTPDGPGGPSVMAQMLLKAKSGGVFEKSFDDLRRVAQESVDEIRKLGDKEVGDKILDFLMTNHVPIVPADESKRMMLEMNLAKGDGIGTAGPGVQPFQMRRTTHQRYFQGPDGKWRWYFGFDEHLPKIKGQMIGEDGNWLPIPEIAKKLDVPDDVAQQYIQAIEAQDVWADMLKADPRVDAQFPWKPTDAYELNDLFHRGRMRALVGSSKAPEDLFDTRFSVVQGARMAMHQRAVSQQKLARLAEVNMLQFPSKDAMLRSAAETGKVVQTRAGVDAKVVGLDKSALGGMVPVFEIGGERYRAIDPNVRAGFIGRLLPETIDRGIVRTEVADLIEKAADLSRYENVSPILNFADHLQGLWKKTTLFNPSWTVNDTIGNLWLAVTGGARVQDMRKHATSVYRLRSLLHSPDKAASITVKLGDGRTINGMDLLHAMVQRRVFENSLPAEVAAQMAKENPSILSKPDGWLNKVFAPNLRLNSQAQDTVRGMAFMSYLEQGADIETAAQRTINSLMDWSDFTRVEQRLFRRLFPFYSWMRNNLGYQMHLLANDPKWAASVPKLRQALEESFAGDAVVPEQERPSWMREALATQLTSDPNSRIGLMFAQALPAGDLIQFMAPLVGTEGAMKFAHVFGSSISPLLKVPLEIGAGEEFFSGRTIGADKFSADLSIGEYATNQIAPINTIRKTAEAAGRSGAEAGLRIAFGGRVQAMDDARLVSTLDREDRDMERRLRGAITRAERRGDMDTVAEAKARLLRMYENRANRGAKIPDSARAQLAAMAEADE